MLYASWLFARKHALLFAESLKRPFNVDICDEIFCEYVRKCGFVLEDIDAIEKASTNGEVINDFDKRQQRSANEKTS
ncbi:CLUMA_CG014786, isoform A [Clunio marinus]|uniref:CLUMA_CG014786, isoform A n=1 Tax=Clunio marinus TaxID=568069 RepID=A0A1J1IMV7_9DIPT|nr:CLUMA_CG014786, isoform A [Clunio marinus]